MRKKKLIPALALALIMVSSFTLGASASNGLQEITAYLNSNITVKMDGEAQTFLNAQGTRVYPITYQGTTYLPVRAVAGLVGLDVNWDQATQTVELGQTKGVDLIDTYKAYNFAFGGGNKNAKCGQRQSSEGLTEDISGVSCSHWLWFTTNTTGAGTSATSFNLGGKHDTLTFSYYSKEDATLTVLGDNGSVLGEYMIPGGAVAQTVTIPLLHTSELTFQMATGKWRNSAYVFNAYLDAE